MADLDQFQTIVIVMMENQSFDHVLGHLSMARFGNRKDVEGLVDPETNLDYTNFLDGYGYQPFELKDGPLLHDLPHSRARVATQLAKAGSRFTMSGFVDAYFQETGSKVKDPPSLGFLSPGDTPISSFLAAQYAVCDNWFAPLPTDTQPNRSIAYSGYSLIDDTKPRLIPTVKGSFIFEWLNARNVSWRVYHCGVSFFTLFDRFHEEVLGPDFRSFRHFRADFESESVEEMPSVIFIEPEYTDSPVHFGWIPNDNHPPTPIGPGENFLRDIYSLLTRDSAKWNRTLLITTHDEHGGFSTMFRRSRSLPRFRLIRYSKPRLTAPARGFRLLSHHHGSGQVLFSRDRWITRRFCNYYPRSSPVRRTITMRSREGENWEYRACQTYSPSYLLNQEPTPRHHHGRRFPARQRRHRSLIRRPIVNRLSARLQKIF